jgi:hypothetical protein
VPSIDVTRGPCDLVEREVAMANGRKVQRAEAEGLLREWKDSGEQMSVWCESRGISWYSLSAHKGWGAERSAADVAFAEVVVRESSLVAVVPESKPAVVLPKSKVPASKPAAAVVLESKPATAVVQPKPEVSASKSPAVLVVPASKAEAAVVCAGRPRYRVAVGEILLEVDDDFRSETLQRLLRAVATC